MNDEGVELAKQLWQSSLDINTKQREVITFLAQFLPSEHKEEYNKLITELNDLQHSGIIYMEKMAKIVKVKDKDERKVTQ